MRELNPRPLASYAATAVQTVLHTRCYFVRNYCCNSSRMHTAHCGHIANGNSLKYSPELSVWCRSSQPACTGNYREIKGKRFLAGCYSTTKPRVLILHSPRIELGSAPCCGVGGYRSPYLSHAKRALYHVSYDPKRIPPPGLEPGSQE